MQYRSLSAAHRPVYSSAVTYELVTRKGTRIVWGNPPEKERQAEASAADKVQRLVEYAQRHGSLDGPSVIDLTDFRAMRITPRIAGSLPDNDSQRESRVPKSAQQSASQQR